jgi:dual specificity tyrosine-phosphorylation-regulated kinase 1
VQLTTSLLASYKDINRSYYENRAKKREDVGKAGWDDEHSDYIVISGEEILDRYIVRGRIGRGSFGQVLKAFDKVTSTDVALKVIKSRKNFKSQANTELDILLELRDRSEHIVRLLNHFEHRGHPCLVFENLSCNLYELLKNTKFRGVSLDLIHKFARQILAGLIVCEASGIIHADLKPENILLVQPKRSAIKLIDFGSSCKRDRKMYSYIQSRFYRSPEVSSCCENGNRRCFFN